MQIWYHIELKFKNGHYIATKVPTYMKLLTCMKGSYRLLHFFY